VGDPDFDLFRATTESRSLPVFTISSGDKMKFDDVLIEVLWPPAAAATAPSRNNDSVVLRVVFGNRSILLTGDIEAAAELALARMTQNLGVDVLKVAHHGSKSSSTDSFVRATHPRLAIISVGRKSMFGHPHPEVVQRWLESGAQVFTTGKCGTITLETDGEQLGMKTFVESPECVSP
jgi:competence protein ComEC